MVYFQLPCLITSGSIHIYIYIWANYNNSQTWNKAIWGYIYIYQRDDIGKCGFFSERWREAEMVKRGEADHPSISLLDGLRFLRARDLRRIWSRGDPPWFTQKMGGFIQKMDGFTQKMGGFTQKMGGFTQKMGGFTIVYCMFTRG